MVYGDFNVVGRAVTEDGSDARDRRDGDVFTCCEECCPMMLGTGIPCLPDTKGTEISNTARSIPRVRTLLHGKENLIR